jgi:hypothetical protein
VANPIFESRTYRRDIAEARELQRVLAQQFFLETDFLPIVTGARISPADVILTGPSNTIWASILDVAAKDEKLEALLVSVGQTLGDPSKNKPVWAAMDAVRQVTQAAGSLATTRLLLSGDRPFLGRKKLRGLVEELRNWKPGASILVVRGDRDSGRTETQNLVDDGLDPNREIFVLLDELFPFETTLQTIWDEARVNKPLPQFAQDALTTESAALILFWRNVKLALDDRDRVMWVLFDDLDKGADRAPVRTVAEVLAILLRDVSYQRRLRLVMLGYPEPQLPSKVTGSIVRNDETDKVDTIDISHVRDFVDYCTKTAGKTVADVEAAASDICTKARKNTSADVPYLQALKDALSEWYRTP